jgi:hypothetical protein
MKHIFFSVIVLSIIICSCTVTKVDKIESSTDPLYSGEIKKISIIQENGVDFSEKLMENVANMMQSCGAEAKFYLSNNFMNSNFFRESDSIMRVMQLNHDERTMRSLYYNGTYVSRVTYEFSVQEVRSKKIIWKAHMDFHRDAPGANYDFKYADPDVQWSKALLNRMVQDGLLKSCGSPQF